MILKIVGVAFVGIICSVLVKQFKPEFSIIISLATGILIVLLVVDALEELILGFVEISENAGVSVNIIKSLIKVIGVGYITEFSADVAEDSGNKSIANKIVFGGKIVVALVALPIIKSLFELIIELV